MSSRFPLTLAVLLVAAGLPDRSMAQGDPLSRFIDRLIKSDPPAPAPTPPAGAPARPPAPAAPRAASPKPAPARPVAAQPAAPRPAPPAVARPAEAAQVVPAAARPAALPSTPQAALQRVNGYFNRIDQLTASFVQSSPSGRSAGRLALKRPGQLQFAYAPPSTLEVVSDGRSVAVRDRKLGTNDVYPIGQTPLKFLLKDDFDLARDTKVRDVQTSPDGIVTVQFDDSATFGGTSRISLRYDAKANVLRQWVVVDPQGFQTTVALSDVDVVWRAGMPD